MSDSSRKHRSRKAPADRPQKPYPDFPLRPHALGYWSKKIKGKVHNFGRWARVVDGKLTPVPYEAGWKEALEVYKAQADDLHAGRAPRSRKGQLTLAGLCNAFLTAKQRKHEAGELSARMYEPGVDADGKPKPRGEYPATTDLILAKLGGEVGGARLVEDLRPEDFEALRAHMAGRWGPVRLGTAVTQIKGVFKYGYEAGLIDQPVRFGPSFTKPSAAVMRKHRADVGEKMLEADQLRKLIDAAPTQVRAMLLLGVNCGFGNHDIANLPLKALDLDGGWVNFARPKTGINRRCPLWPETVAALRLVLAERPEPRQEEAKGLAFLSSRGRQMLVNGIAHPVGTAVRAVMKAVGVHQRGFGPYTLRHVFRTVADGARDQVAANAIMGHADGSMAGAYRERIEDGRLQAVADHVRAWLFPEPTDNDQAEPEAAPAKPAAEPKQTPKDGQRPALRLFVAG